MSNYQKADEVREELFNIICPNGYFTYPFLGLCVKRSEKGECYIMLKTSIDPGEDRYNIPEKINDIKIKLKKSKKNKL